MLECSVCSKLWESHGNSWKRSGSNKIDYRCSVCGAKRKPVEQDFQTGGIVSEEYMEKMEDEALQSLMVSCEGGVPSPIKTTGDSIKNWSESIPYKVGDIIDAYKVGDDGKDKHEITATSSQEALIDLDTPIKITGGAKGGRSSWNLPSITGYKMKPVSEITPLKGKKKVYRKHIILPDKQVTPDSPIEHLDWIGMYISEKRPDVIVDLGDFADMESLSSYDRGKTSFEGRRYIKDIEAAKNAMDIMTKPFRDIEGYDPEMHLVLGNHEHRISRAVEDDQRLEGTISIDNLEYESFGWTVHPFLEIAEIDGVHYSHYFCNQLSGKPIGGESILLRLKNIGFSFVMGHQQIYLTGTRSLNNGKRIRGIVQGACYLHDEFYRGPQANAEWRGIFVLHEVCNGDYSLMEISLDYLCRRYEGVSVWEFMEKKYPKIFAKSTWMKYQREQMRKK